MKIIENENKFMSRISMITSLGDFVSLFAVLLLLEKSGIGPEYNGLNIIFQASAFSLSAMFYPYLVNNLGTKAIIFLSQLISIFASAIILVLYFSNSISLVPFLACTFLLTFCYQAFDNAKNHHSKLIGKSDDHHKKNEVQLLKYFFGAQTIGPLISLALISKFPLWVPLVFDITTFIVCVFLSTKLKVHITKKLESSFLKPFEYIWDFPDLRDITILRSIGFWFGAGIFDYLMIPALTLNYGKSISNLAIIYSTLGLGGAIGVSLIRNPKTELPWFLGKLNMWIGAVIGNLGMTLTMIYFWNQESFLNCGLISVLHGIFMGVLAGSSQSMRKIAASEKQFPEIISIEIAFGRLTAFLFPFIIFKLITTSDISYEKFKFLPAVCSFSLAAIYLIRFGFFGKRVKRELIT